jgi:AAA family ATPase
VESSAVHYASDIKHLFRMASECSPAILYLEDVDDFLKSDGCIDALKTTMDGMKNVDGIVTILVTNSPSALPKSLISRPSRFDDVLVFQLPDKDLRYRILSKIAEPLQIENKESILKELADKTEKLTGAHLKELLIYALLLSADCGRDIITEDDIAKALIKVFGTMDTVDNKIRDVDMKNLAIGLKNVKKN